MENKVQTKLQELFETYSKNLPEKVNSLQIFWQNICEHFDPDAFKSFHREVHNLCGSSGTYGFIALSKSARLLEIYLKGLLGNDFLTREQQIEITRLMNLLMSTALIPENTDYNNVTTKTSEKLEKIIYILEDDEFFLNQLNMILLPVGYKFSCVETFSDLLKLLEKKVPMAMIVNMKFLGEQEAEKLIALQKKNDIFAPLFVSSDKNDIDTRLHAVRAGSSAFFQKPIDILYLSKMIDQMSSWVTDTQFKILIVDDSQSLAEYYSAILQNAGMITKTLTNPLETINAIIEFNPDLLLLDIYMPACTGLELASVLRQDPKYMHIPIIFLSSEEDKFKQLAALNLGGDDFLTKPVLPQHLVAAVKMRARRAGILTSYIIKDSLTGLINHSNILHQLDLELARAEKNHQQLTFIMLDIDYFKKVNDRFGHLTGDQVLRKLAEVLSSRLRKTDYLGRYGGEEFAIILPNTPINEGKRIIEELREKMAEVKFHENQETFSITFSAGIAGFPTLNQAKNIIEAADTALYQAKKNGRNQVVINEGEAQGSNLS